jgi:hypothetical protein
VELLYFSTYLHRNTTYPFPLLTLTYLYLKWGVFLTIGCKYSGKLDFDNTWITHHYHHSYYTNITSGRPKQVKLSFVQRLTEGSY